MHLGHQALLRSMIDSAQSQNLQSAVLTFEPHPREFFAAHTAPARLSSMREKLEHFAEAGVAQCYVCRFNTAFAKISAAQFMQGILRDSLNAKSILDLARNGPVRWQTLLQPSLIYRPCRKWI